MGWNGAGAVIRTDGVRSGSDVHAQQKTANIKVRADLTDVELEDLASAIENAVARDGQNAASANLPMGTFKHTGVATGSGSGSRSEYASGATVQDGAILDAGDTGGTTSAYTATLSPAIAAYADKQLFRVKFNATCAGTPTINFNTVGAKKLYKLVGTTATQLAAGDAPQNFVALLRYDSALDGASGGFWVLNFTGLDINGLTTDSTPDSNADFVPTRDTSASGNKKATIASFSTMPRGYLAGLGLANNGSDATNDIDIAVGQARDGANAADLFLASALTKRLDASWAVGTNQGGLDTGSIANTTYHVWLIRRSDTGVVDALFSASASSPTMPANYDQKRRIGSILRESAAIVAFAQTGDLFLRKSPLLDITAATPGSSAVTRTLLVPTGIVVEALINFSLSATTNDFAYFSALSQTDLAASNTAAPLAQGGIAGAGVTSLGAARVLTNTSAQIRSRLLSGAGGTLYISSQGWIDTRGRND